MGTGAGAEQHGGDGKGAEQEAPGGMGQSSSERKEMQSIESVGRLGDGTVGIHTL